MLEHVRHLDNEEMPNACDVEDWLNLENELSTSPQMSDEEILATNDIDPVQLMQLRRMMDFAMRSSYKS
ncbi:unnamed protein product, partial [Pocillopora meandrina]